MPDNMCKYLRLDMIIFIKVTVEYRLRKDDMNYQKDHSETFLRSSWSLNVIISFCSLRSLIFWYKILSSICLNIFYLYFTYIFIIINSEWFMRIN